LHRGASSGDIGSSHDLDHVAVEDGMVATDALAVEAG
jgi:hypothetical protein